MPGFHFSRLYRPTVSLALTMSMLGGAGGLQAQDAASGNATPKGKDAPRSVLPRDAHTKLNFIRKEWSEVLQKVADDTHSTLVMTDAPQGLYTRSDFESHSREEAIKILNRDLHRIGFHLVGDENELRVQRIQREKVDYPQHVSQPAAAVEAPRAEVRRPVTEQRRPQAGFDRSVRPAGFEDGNQRVKAAPLAIQPQNRPAMDIAKSLRGTFKDRARLENVGPNGYPAFVVDTFKTEVGQAAEPLFTLEIDSQQNQLYVSAEREVQTALRNLVNKIDLNPLTMDDAPAILAGTGNTVQLADQLKGPLHQMLQARQAQPGATNLLAQGAVQPGVGGAPQPNVQVVPGVGNAQSLPGLLANLRSDVTIETIPELDLLIIRGNEADVNAVKEIIATIEKLAQGSLPIVNLVPLQHVDSVSMSSLLQNVFSTVASLRANAAQYQNVLVSVIPVVTPNSVIVIGTQGAQDSVTKLVAQLDQPVNADFDLKVFRIRHGIASVILTQLQTFFQTQRAGLDNVALQAVADVYTNTIVVQAAPSNMREIEKLIATYDREEGSSAVSDVKIVALRSASSDQMAITINNIIQSTFASPPGATPPGQQTGVGVGAQAPGNINTTVAAVALQLFSENRQVLLESGMLHQIRLNSDNRTNSLIISAPAKAMDLLLELVKILDRPSDQVAQVKIFNLRNADATDAQLLLNNLFAPTQAAGGAVGAAAAQQVQPFDYAGTEGTGSALIPLRISVDPRTNSIAVIGTPALLDLVQSILYVVDADTTMRRETIKYRLKNASADVVATALQTFYQNRLTIITTLADLTSNSQILDQQVIVTPEPATNNLIISVTPNYRDEIMELVEQLDANPLQVVISALIVEVELTNVDEFGVELGLQDRILFNRSIANVPGFLFNNNPLGNNTAAANSSTVGTQGLSNFGVGRTNPNLGYGGLVLSASSESVSVLIRALATRRNVRVLSRPQIRALDNWQAYIQVGQEVPITNGVTITQGIVSPNVTRDSAGIILVVTPRISADGSVVMQVGAEKSAYQPGGVPIFTDVNTGNVVTSPIKDLTQAVTTIRVPDGQTVVVGGMITSSQVNEERGVPWFKDLPFVGKAFRFDGVNDRKTELLIFLTPHVLRVDADSEMINRVEAGRLRWFQDEAEAIHGPIFGVTPDMVQPPYGGMVEPYCPPGQVPGGQIPGGQYPQGEMMIPPAGQLHGPELSPTPPPAPNAFMPSRKLTPVSQAAGGQQEWAN